MVSVESLPDWMEGTLGRSLVLQAATSGTDAPLRTMVCAENGELERVEEVLLELYENPARISAPVRKSTLDIDSKPSDAAPDVLVVKAPKSMSLKQMEYLPELDFDLEFDAHGSTPKMPASVPVVLLTTPEEGFWEDYYAIYEQLQVDSVVSSRFHLTSVVRSPDHPSAVEEMASDYVNPSSLDLADLREAVGTARSRARPTIGETHHEKFIESAKSWRAATSDWMTFSIRNHIEPLCILAEAEARLGGRSEVSEADVERAVELMDELFRHLGFGEQIGRTGEFDIDMVETGDIKAHRNRKRDILEIVEGLSTDDNDLEQPMASREDIIERAEEEGYDIDRVEKDITKMIAQGELMEPRNDWYAVLPT